MLEALINAIALPEVMSGIALVWTTWFIVNRVM